MNSLVHLALGSWDRFKIVRMRATHELRPRRCCILTS